MEKSVALKIHSNAIGSRGGRPKHGFPLEHLEAVAVGAVVNLKKMAKHFAVDIRDGHFAWHRREDQRRR
jgi:hypothetical protein